MLFIKILIWNLILPQVFGPVFGHEPFSSFSFPLWSILSPSQPISAWALILYCWRIKFLSSPSLKSYNYLRARFFQWHSVTSPLSLRSLIFNKSFLLTDKICSTFYGINFVYYFLCSDTLSSAALNLSVNTMTFLLTDRQSGPMTSPESKGYLR